MRIIVLVIIFAFLQMSCNSEFVDEEIIYLYEKGEYNKVIEKCEAILKKNQSSEALSYRGNSYLRLEKFQEAYNDFFQLYQLGDTTINTLEGLGISSASIGASEPALKIFQKLLTLDGDSSTYLFYLSLVCFDLGQDSLAMKYTEMAISMDSDNHTFLNRMGILLQGLNRFEESITYFSRIIDSKEGCKNDTIFYNRAASYSYIGEFDSTILDMTTAISINSRNPIYYFERAGLYKKKNERDKCCSDLNKAKSLGYLIAEDDELAKYCK